MGAVITVVGIGADGHLPPAARTLVGGAEVLLGGERHLALVPAVPGQVRRPWPRPLSALPGVLSEHDGHSIVALASGDPLVSGIGTTLIRLLGADAVDVVPAVSSVSLARARMGWSAEESTVVTLVGRDVDALRRELAPGRRLLVLSSDETTPAAVATLLEDAGFGATAIHVLGDLGGPGGAETHAVYPCPVPRLHLLALEVAGTGTASWATGLPDDAFEHDGQLTKRDVRASALARLAPRPGDHLWDVGAGAGSVAIEWLRAHPLTTAVAVEGDEDRAARIRRNASRLGVPRLEVVIGRAPEALAGLPTPDAVFVGGGATADGLLDRCRDALAPGGRLVAHGVTLETERLLVGAWHTYGGELTRLAVEQATPLGGRFTGWTPARAVVQWAWTRSTEGATR
ncbi:precorrin-6y C5,15-methyltransferase (decarboxylating) subunit CbiE [Nocardioides daeguensis]|uniref:Bifunctional cobalt-precorrin-7 (C(5))-methyltransferase/cobalt-precorrin-6B (C(15))-methyltransferase n=1 Tax=Nocardioides daeguensis TaxID=908359 RepID=A0ABP6VQ90_9ACTN|nr:precorrin-6y C5,15-methyltransferase (decarboxylating) subunit CbiE [Nocardioides daeguensis]MBV6727509.1 precorrin-6y C5,15-methyltransferase (decarboxylating) subunit CbiE [Nocardioides daeguensis]MCR1773269.1 precorrin-6y C5,15-methyltransferase (decarboxylating) subunit CbiE [Nocardioides daeguensis]